MLLQITSPKSGLRRGTRQSDTQLQGGPGGAHKDRAYGGARCAATAILRSASMNVSRHHAACHVWSHMPCLVAYVESLPMMGVGACLSVTLTSPFRPKLRLLEDNLSTGTAGRTYRLHFLLAV